MNSQRLTPVLLAIGLLTACNTGSNDKRLPGESDQTVDLNPAIDTTGLDLVDEFGNQVLGGFTLGLGTGGTAATNRIQSGIYSGLDGFTITGSGLTEDGQPCPPEPADCPDRGQYDPVTGILTANITVTNNTGALRTCVAVQYLAELINHYGPQCPGAPYDSVGGNSNAPCAFLPYDQIRKCAGCEGENCFCFTDQDCENKGGGTCDLTGARTEDHTNLYVLGALEPGESESVTIQIKGSEGSFCPHFFVVVDETAGNESGLGCLVTCGDRIIASNNEETCEPFGTGTCSQERGTVPPGITDLSCSRDWECVFEGVCDNSPEEGDIICVNNHQCPPLDANDPGDLPRDHCDEDGLNCKGHIPSSRRGHCTVSYDWGPCSNPEPFHDMGCKHQEICLCQSTGQIPDVLGQDCHTTFNEIEHNMPGECKLAYGDVNSPDVCPPYNDSRPDPEVHWGYSGEIGPEFWGGLSPKFTTCSVGELQAPLDIPAGIDPSGSGDLNVDYKDSTSNLLYNGHTLQANYDAGSKLTVAGKTFELKQFHFHTPSENKVNGKQYPLEVHLVHSDDHNNLAVVGVLIEEGEANALLEQLQPLWPDTEESEPPVHAVHVDCRKINANALLPADKSTFRFNGSLTTPPCTEGVKWNLMADPITASQEQIEFFNEAFGGNNARPTQPVNERPISDQ